MSSEMKPTWVLRPMSLVVFGAGLGRDEGDDGRAVGRSDGDPAAVEVEAGVGNDAEAELVDVEL